jgi:hypothetical protein
MILALLSATPAYGGEASTIIERCTHGKSLGGFSQNGYREALKQMPTEVSEYSDCVNSIRKAELAAVGGAPAGEGAGGSTAAIALTPSEQRQVQAAHRLGAAPVHLGSGAGVVRPGVVRADIASVTSTLPSSLLAVLALLIAGGLALAGGGVYRRVRAGRHR